MIPKILHQTSRCMSPEEIRLRRRAQSKLPGWEFRLWSDAANEALVKHSFPQYIDQYRSIKRGVVKADIARYMYLSVFGGIYLDTDYKILRPIDDETLSYACVLPISRNSESIFRLGNAVLGSEPGHPFWDDFIAKIFGEGRIADLAESRIEAVTGPEGLTEFYLLNKNRYSDVYCPQREIFHPALSLGGLSFQGNRSTVGVHLCWGSWRTKNVAGMIRRLVQRKVTSF